VEGTVGCEAIGPYWLSLDEAITAQDYRVLVLNPLYVQARRGTTLCGTKTDPVDVQLMAESLQRENVPTSQVPAATVQGLCDFTRLRADLVAQVGDVKQSILSMLDHTFPEFATCFTDVCVLMAGGVLETWMLPEQLTAVPTARLRPGWRGSRLTTLGPRQLGWSKRPRSRVSGDGGALMRWCLN
jgi:transposase